MTSSEAAWAVIKTKLAWPLLPLAAVLLCSYVVLVRAHRYRRMEVIRGPFARGKRPLSSMTTKEAHEIIAQLQELEFPSAFAKARRIALLKVSEDCPWYAR